MQTQESRIRAHVEECIHKFAEQCGPQFQMHAAVGAGRDHIINIGTSVLCTKWEVGYPGGSFVQAVVDNNLMEAFGRADSINRDCIMFYLMLLRNSSYIE